MQFLLGYSLLDLCVMFSFVCTALFPLDIKHADLQPFNEKKETNYLFIEDVGNKIIYKTSSSSSWLSLLLSIAADLCLTNVFYSWFFPFCISVFVRATYQCVYALHYVYLCCLRIQRPYLQWRPNDTSKFALFLLKMINYTLKTLKTPKFFNMNL